MGAEAVVRLVYGEETPSGKLSVSIPWGVGQVPVSYWDVKTGHRMTETNPENRFTSRYMDIPNEPLYPFGFGLSYTGFTITPPVLEKQEREDKIGILCKVKNVGEVPGAEVVQCYVETLCAPVLSGSGKFSCSLVKNRKSNLRLTGKNWLFTERIWNS